MLKKFATWFIVFGLSFLISEVFRWTEQGKAFLYIHLGSGIVITIVLIIIFIIAGIFDKVSLLVNIESIVLLFVIAFKIGIVLFATWGATRLFNVDFFVAYQIMTLGQCLCPNIKKKDDD